MPERKLMPSRLTRRPLARSRALAALMLAERPRALLAVALGVAASACGSADTEPSALPSAGASSGGTSSAGASNAGTGNAGASGASGGGTGGSGAGTGGSASGMGTCNVDIVESPPASAVHRTQCTPIDYSTNPPSGGDHYAIWAAFQTYGYPVPVGFVVHALEHGAIALWYNCPGGCADEVSEVQAFIDSQAEDPLCEDRSAVRRALLLPNPALPSRWAASAWGYALTADCFDEAEFGAFYTAHYGQAPEQLCNDGQVIPANACP
jgi:hypothetical protein